MAASGSTRVVVAALAANGMIAIAKFAAAAWTGSAAMLSEAIHSLADTANQGLLLHGMRRAARPADDRHPFGYAKELYFWAFVVAILLFSLGAGVAIYEGVDKLRHPHPVTDPLINYAILGIAIVVEVASTVVALREFNRQRGDAALLAALRSSKDPALFTVLLENLAALAGLVVAFAGIAASHLLGWPAGDAIASIVIGIILGLVAAFMSIETKGLLIGEAASQQVSDAIATIISGEIGGAGPLTGMGRLKTMHLGPDHVIATAPLDFKDGLSAADVEATVARLEARIRTRFPQVRQLLLEARDITSATALEASAAATSAATAATLAPAASVAPTPRSTPGPVPKSNHPASKKSRKAKKGRR